MIRVQEIAPTPGITSSHRPISRLFTVRLDDGSVVEPPLLVSDLEVVPRDHGRKPPARPSAGTIIVAILAGLLVLLLLFPASGVDSDPPVCRSMLFYVVPCDRWVAPLAGAVTAGLVGLASWKAIDRRR